jgi:hypothetical protein
MRTKWLHGDVLYFGNIYVAQVMRFNASRWRAWIMLIDEENDPGCHLGWFSTRDEAMKCAQDRAELEIESALTER